MSDDETDLFARVPSTLKVLADEDDRALKEIVTAGIERELGVGAGDSAAVIDRKIARVEDELEEARSAMERHRERVHELQDELERYRELREERVEAAAAYEEDLDDLLDTLEGGDAPDNVWPTHPAVADIADGHDRPHDEVHLDLEQRATEQRRELTVASFKDGSKATADDRRTPIWEKWDGDGDAGGDGA